MTKYVNNVLEINNAYHHMMHRCYDMADISYPNYGGSGVVVCEIWKGDYQKFLDWALSNGWKSGLQLDKDINGNGKLYSPEFCSWVTKKENSRHRKTSVWFIINGKKLNLKEVSELTGLERRTISKRLKLGWSKDNAITKPKRHEGAGRKNT